MAHIDGIRPFLWEKPVLRVLDQRRLPGTVAFIECRTAEDVAEAIRSMAVRGAPAIGAAAAFGLVIAAGAIAAAVGQDAEAFRAGLVQAGAMLESTRPTAVNLSWAVRRMLRRAEELLPQGVAATVAGLEREAEAIAAEDAAANTALSRYGAALLAKGDHLLTYCNTGALATAGIGTALGIIRAGWEEGKVGHVYVCETRPFLQGARLTAWELVQEGIPATLITDNAAGWLMKQGKVQAVIVGADRVAANGDVANKIGTYSLAVLARAHGIPFYVAAPFSSVDLAVATGNDIVVEERDPAEVTHVAGVAVAPDGIGVFNPAFDVTPHPYVSAIITERGVVRPPFDVGLRELGARRK